MKARSTVLSSTGTGEVIRLVRRDLEVPQPRSAPELLPCAPEQPARPVRSTPSGTRWRPVADGLAAALVIAWWAPALAVVAAVAWPVMVAAHRGYEQRWCSPRIRPHLAAGAGLAILGAAAAPLAGASTEARVLVVVVLLVVAASVSLSRIEVRVAARRSTGRRRLVVAGPRQDLTRVVDDLTAGSGVTCEVVAACTDETAGSDAVLRAVQEHAPDGVVVLPGHQFDPLELRRLGWALADRGTEMFVATGLIDVAAQRSSDLSLGHLQVRHVRAPELAGARRRFKRGWERTAAAVGLVLLAPLLAVIALAVRCDSPGTAFYRQRRVGREGEPFVMLKFRTMTRDAHRARADLENDCDGVLFKSREDPRVTRVGRVLRKYSLDELPQLVNVLRGEMSLVGPRPPLETEVAAYPEDVRHRLAVLPGLTGLWQVSGRSDLSWEESVRLDLSYVDNWTLRNDLAILARTVPAVVTHRGAY